MDINANLAEQRKIAKAILSGEAVVSQALRLAELVVALDEWIGKGGAVPDRWLCAMMRDQAARGGKGE